MVNNTNHLISTTYILHPTFYILHPTFYILHPTSYILHPTFYFLTLGPWPLNPDPYFFPFFFPAGIFAGSGCSGASTFGTVVSILTRGRLTNIRSTTD